MKRYICFVLCILTAVFSVLPAAAAEPELTSSSAVLIDMKNEMVLYEKNENQKIQPAGFTKIVTAIAVLENCDDLSQVITASADTISACDFSFGNMGILAGENLSVEALLNGMLIYDAAEAAELLAGFTFGNYGKFIAEMNRIADMVGAKDTAFVNAGGYYNENQYTTPADIAKIALYAMKNDTFAQIVKKDMVELAPTNKYRETRYLSNTNLFVGKARSLDFFSSKVFGVKTSYMKEHGYGICIAFENSRGKFLCVTAGASGSANAHTDAQHLREFVIDGFTNVKLAEKGDIIEEVDIPNGKTDHVLLKTAEELSVRLPVDYDENKITRWTSKLGELRAPIEKGQVLGSLNISYDGTVAGSVDLIAYEAVERSGGKSIGLFFKAIFTSPFFYVTVVILVLVFFILIFKAVNEKKRRRRKFK